MKTKVDKLDRDKLVPVLVDLIKRSDVAANDVVKKDVNNAKTKNSEDKILDITNLAINTSFSTKIKEVKGETPSITNLANNASLNTKINAVKGEIRNSNNLATTTAPIAVEKKTPDVSNLVKKTDYNTKISENENKTITDHDHDKYITTQEFSKLTSEKFPARLKSANLASKK